MLDLIQLIQEKTNVYWGDLHLETKSENQYLQKASIIGILEMMPNILYTVEQQADTVSRFYLWYIKTHPIYSVRHTDVVTHAKNYLSIVKNELYCDWCCEQAHEETRIEIIVDELLEELEIGEEEIW